MAFHQARKFKNARLGGLRKEIETDVFELGKKPKNGLGMKFINKAYVQYLCERGGDVIMEPFPNPTGGSEALRQIGPLLTDKVAPQSILHSDSARAVKAWVDDHPDKDLIHVCVNHAQSKHFGFVWHLYVDENDGPHFAELTDGKFEIIRAGTQHADGFCTIVKNAFKQRGGVLRKNVKAEIKEIQYRTNTSTFNIYDNFLEAWGDLENELREEKTTIKKVKKELMPEITKFMVLYNIADLNTEDGKLKCSERKTKQTISKNYLIQELTNSLGDNQEQINKCMDNILLNRQIKITHILRKCKK